MGQNYLAEESYVRVDLWCQFDSSGVVGGFKKIENAPSSVNPQSSQGVCPDYGMVMYDGTNPATGLPADLNNTAYWANSPTNEYICVLDSTTDTALTWQEKQVFDKHSRSLLHTDVSEVNPVVTDVRQGAETGVWHIY